MPLSRTGHGATPYRPTTVRGDAVAPPCSDAYPTDAAAALYSAEIISHAPGDPKRSETPGLYGKPGFLLWIDDFGGQVYCMIPNPFTPDGKYDGSSSCQSNWTMLGSSGGRGFRSRETVDRNEERAR